MIHAAFAFPGDLATPTGGYAYDRAVLEHLPRFGIAVAALALGEGFPFPSERASAEAERRLAATAPDAVLLVDGLALGALPDEALKPVRQRLVGLVHHPLALEEGLSADARARLAASERSALALCAAIVVTSAATAETLARDYGVPRAHITVAVPGMDDLPRARRREDAGVVQLLAVGSLVPRKGYDVLLDALATLRDLPFTLTIVGSDTLDLATARRIADRVRAEGLAERVTLAGALAADDLATLYETADAFVHPALYEGYGMALAEALRRGLPMVASTGGAAGETVPDGAALKVPPGDAAAFAAALRRLLSEPALRAELADAAHAAGRALPGWDETARLIACVLRQVRHRQAGAAA